MKIAVASDDGKQICGHLGRCRSFVVFDIKDGKIDSVEVRKNTFTAHAGGNPAHHQHHQPGHSNHSHTGVIEALNDCQVVISQGMGWRVAKDLEDAKIQPIITDETDAETAVQRFLKNELEHLSGQACGCGK